MRLKLACDLNAKLLRLYFGGSVGLQPYDKPGKMRGALALALSL
jgi:hypothetical protein